MSTEFANLRQRGIYATLQTLPSGFRVTLQKGSRTCWGVGSTSEEALAAALVEWERKNDGKQLPKI